MQKYWYTLNDDGSIYALLKQKKCSNGVQITRVEYDKFKAILASIPNKEGYDRIVKLYPDFTYTVEYIPIEEIVIDEN